MQDNNKQYNGTKKKKICGSYYFQCHSYKHFPQLTSLEKSNIKDALNKTEHYYEMIGKQIFKCKFCLKIVNGMKKFKIHMNGVHKLNKLGYDVDKASSQITLPGLDPISSQEIRHQIANRATTSRNQSSNKSQMTDLKQSNKSQFLHPTNQIFIIDKQQATLRNIFKLESNSIRHANEITKLKKEKEAKQN